jgi:hypothetical protein
MTVLPQLQAALLAAHDRRERKRRARRRTVIALAVLFGVPILGGGALAATGVWAPPLGDHARGRPTRGLSGPPHSQLAEMGVLRRPQTAQDRGPEVRKALTFLAAHSVQGVRTNSVRYLGRGLNGRAIVLVPVEHYNLGAPGLLQSLPPSHHRNLGRFQPKHDGLCVITLDSDGAGFACFPIAYVHSGSATGSLGLQLYLLVPDGVSRVRIRFNSGQVRSGAVHDNLFTVISPAHRPHLGLIGVGPAVPDVPGSLYDFRQSETWYDKDGRVIGPPH